MSSSPAPPVELLRAAPLCARPAVVHGFTTRRGGVTPPPRDSLHLALRDDDDGELVLENWRRVARALHGGPQDLVLLDQVHGAEVITVSEPTGPQRTAAAADGVVTSTPGLLLAVRTADCVPVLLAAPGAVGAAHAGWRGIVAGVVPRTVARLAELAGCAPADVIAGVGPHASVEAYETGPEVVDALAAAGLERDRIHRIGPGGREHADLRRAVEDQLRAAGVRTIGHVRRCTLTEPDFFSHRRDGPATGRQASVIGLRRESG